MAANGNARCVIIMLLSCQDSAANFGLQGSCRSFLQDDFEILRGSLAMLGFVYESRFFSL